MNREDIEKYFEQKVFLIIGKGIKKYSGTIEKLEDYSFILKDTSGTDVNIEYKLVSLITEFTNRNLRKRK